MRHPNALKVRRALSLVREARDLLRAAGARNAYKRVASVVHSVEGAARHAELVANRAPPDRPDTSGVHDPQVLYDSGKGGKP